MCLHVRKAKPREQGRNKHLVGGLWIQTCACLLGPLLCSTLSSPGHSGRSVLREERRESDVCLRK